MKKEVVVRIKTDGTAETLWTDALGALTAKKNVERASEVEYHDSLRPIDGQMHDKGSWAIKILIGPHAGLFVCETAQLNPPENRQSLQEPFLPGFWLTQVPVWGYGSRETALKVEVAYFNNLLKERSIADGKDSPATTK